MVEYKWAVRSGYAYYIFTLLTKFLNEQPCEVEAWRISSEIKLMMVYKGLPSKATESYSEST